jgi:hypothetical protein
MENEIIIGEWEKWTWLPFVVYMKVRNIQERHWNSMVTGLSKSLDHNEPLESNNETAEVEIALQLSMQKLTRAIDKKMNSKIIFKSRTTKDVTSIVKEELAIFEVESKLGANFESFQKFEFNNS